jgi:hypothetical protein
MKPGKKLAVAAAHRFCNEGLGGSTVIALRAANAIAARLGYLAVSGRSVERVANE